MIRAGLVAALLCLSGCGSWEAVRDQQAQRYVGHPVDRMYAEWGAPYNQAPLSGGGYFYQFAVIKAIYRCEADAWTNSSGVVTQIQVGGQNGCLTE